MVDNPYDGPEQPAGAAPVIQGKGCSWVTIAVSLGIALVLISLLLPAFHRGPELGRRTQCRNNLKQIALALHNYHDKYDVLPPAYTVDQNGQPLHSWRTLILPFLERNGLYDSIDLSQPWNASANKKAGEVRLPVYECPSSVLPEGFTTYMAIVGEDYAFHPDRSRTLSEFTDDTSNTLMVIEVPITSATHWMNPKDAAPAFLLGNMEDLEFGHNGGMQAAMADGRAVFLSATNAIEELGSLLTIAAGDHPQWDTGNNAVDKDQNSIEPEDSRLDQENR